MSEGIGSEAFAPASLQNLQFLLQTLSQAQAAQQADIAQQEQAGIEDGASPSIPFNADLAAALSSAPLMQLLSMPGANPADLMATLTGGDSMSLQDDDSDANQKPAGSKTRRAAWTQDEEARLTDLATRYQASGQRMCWRNIAQELGTGRTSKQCREHYLNSLRPNMKKGQWTQREEYVIAREHSKIGSHWCMIAKKLPGRTDNSIKNFYNATVRSKAVNKNDSFLWLYVRNIMKGMSGKDSFQDAYDIWTQNAPPATVQEVLNGADYDEGSSSISSIPGLSSLNPETLEMLSQMGGSALLQQVANGLSNLTPAAAAAAAAAAMNGGLGLHANMDLLHSMSGAGGSTRTAEDGAEALMLLAGKAAKDTAVPIASPPTPHDGESLESVLARVNAGASRQNATNVPKMSDLLNGVAGIKRERVSSEGDEEDEEEEEVEHVKRQRLMDQVGGVTGQMSADATRAELLQQLGVSLGQQSSPTEAGMSQLLFQQLLAAASSPTSAGALSGAVHGSGGPAGLAALLQSLGHSAGAAASGASSLMSLLEGVNAQTPVQDLPEPVSTGNGEESHAPDPMSLAHQVSMLKAGARHHHHHHIAAAAHAQHATYGAHITDPETHAQLQHIATVAAAAAAASGGSIDPAILQQLGLAPALVNMHAHLEHDPHVLPHLHQPQLQAIQAGDDGVGEDGEEDEVDH